MLTSYIFVCGCISNGDLNGFQETIPNYFPKQALSCFHLVAYYIKCKDEIHGSFPHLWGGGKVIWCTLDNVSAQRYVFRYVHDVMTYVGSRLDHHIYMCPNHVESNKVFSHV